MAKNSGLTNRDVVNHGGAGKGDKNRVTDVKAFRENYDAIDWGGPRDVEVPEDWIRALDDDEKLSFKQVIRRGREIATEADEKEFRHGL